jgi:predicted glycosyltransferase
MRIWFDVDNPPQAQYLLPLGQTFEDAGDDLLVTARNYGITFDLLKQRGTPFVPVGQRFGKTRLAKAFGLVSRALALVAAVRRAGGVDALVSSSRPSALAARLLRIPAFIVCDYEFVDLQTYRRLDVHLLFPDVINPSVFLGQGFEGSRLMPFHGLKEDLSFSGAPIESLPPYAPAAIDDQLVRALFRPPADESHYYTERSGSLAWDLLAYLAAAENVVVLFAPRYPRQQREVGRFAWRNQPVLLDEAIPFVPLLKASDVVFSSGGTMLREAAYMGIPTYSAFGGRKGAVDTYLEAIGRLQFLDSPADFQRIALEKRDGYRPLRANPALPVQLLEMIRERVQHRRSNLRLHAAN